MDLLATKILTVVILWLVTFLFANLPMLVSRIIKRRKQSSEEKEADHQSSVLDRLNFVAGGVFLATIFLDLLPEATETLAEALRKHGMVVKVPMTPLIMAMGMLLFMHFEHLTLMLKDYWSRTGQDHVELLAGSTGSLDEEVELYSIKHGTEKETELNEDNLEKKDKCLEFHDSSIIEESSESGALLKKDVTADIDPGRFDKSGDHLPPRPPADLTASIESSEESILVHSYHDHTHKSVNTALRSYILVIALSLHSVFDGIVIGLSSKTADVWTLFTAVVFHKTLVALSLGSKLLKMSHCITKRTIFCLLLVFTLTTPIGGAIGIVMTNTGRNNGGGGLAEGILISIATGTFTYVTFFEMLKFEGDSKSNLINSVLVTLGFAVTATGISFQGDPAEIGEIETTVSRP